MYIGIKSNHLYLPISFDLICFQNFIYKKVFLKIIKFKKKKKMGNLQFNITGIESIPKHILNISNTNENPIIKNNKSAGKNKKNKRG